MAGPPGTTRTAVHLPDEHAERRQGPGSLEPQDTYAVAAIALLFVATVALTWHRWTFPLMDHGREMNVPARLLAGERLYVDVYYYYGPLAPYVNAGLYALFGVHLSVLHASGMVCAAWILGVVYWLSRQLLPVAGAALATSLVLVFCALAPYQGNYVQPYAYATLYGWTLAITALACAARYEATSRDGWLLVGSVLSGVALACKPEMGILALAPCALAWVVNCYERRGWLWRSLLRIVIPVTAIALLVYGTLIMAVPWRFLITQTYTSLSQPQMVYFSQGLNGLRMWPRTGYAIVLSLSAWALCGSASLIWAKMEAVTARSPSGRRLARVAAFSLVGSVVYMWGPATSGFFDVVQPLRSTLIVGGVALVYCAWRIVVDGASGHVTPRPTKILFLLSAFALAAITRVFLNVSIQSPYTAFTVPPAIVLYVYLFVDVWPSLFPRHLRASVAAGATGLTAAAMVSLAGAGIGYARAINTTEIRTARGAMLLSPQFAGPLGDAIQFVTTRTAPGQAVVSLPEGSVINFMADRPNPLHDENIMPGYVTPDREREMIRLIDEKQVPVILLLNRVTPEYRDVAFGIDYNQDLLRWIETHYRPVATFGAQPTDGEPKFGDRRFFVRAYERVPDSSPRDTVNDVAGRRQPTAP